MSSRGVAPMNGSFVVAPRRSTRRATTRASTSWKISDDGTDQAWGDKLGAPPSRAEQEESQNGGEVAGSAMKTRAGREVRCCFRQFSMPFDAVFGRRRDGQRWKGVEVTLSFDVVARMAWSSGEQWQVKGFVGVRERKWILRGERKNPKIKKKFVFSLDLKPHVGK